MQAPCGRKKTAPSAASAKTSDWKEVLNAYLKEQGLRVSKQRENVAQVAMTRPTHFEIQNLIREVQSKYPEISPATVYRSVKTLCEAGVLSETLQNDGGVMLYEPHEEEHHDHIICIDCGEIFEFHNEKLEQAQDEAVQALGFTEARHRHVIYAKCALINK